MIKKSVLIGAVGTFILVLFAMIPFLGQSISQSISPIQYDFASKNYNFQIVKKVNDLSEIHGENSYIEQMMKDMKIFDQNKFKFYDYGTDYEKYQDIDKNESLFIATFATPEYAKVLDSYHKNYESIQDFEKKYLYDLMSSGLGSEVEKLPIFIRNSPQTPFSKISVTISPNVKDTFTWKWMQKMNEIVKFDNPEQQKKAYSDERIRKSIFYIDQQQPWDVKYIKDRFSKDFEFFNALEKILKQSDNQEIQILSLIKDIIRANFLISNGKIFEDFEKEADNPNSLYFIENDKNVISNNQKTDWTWAQYLNITPGVRTIQKIMFSLLEKTAYISIQKENGSSQEKIYRNIKTQFWNPFNVFWKQLINIPNDILDTPLNNKLFEINSSGFLPSSLVTTVYDVNGLDRPHNKNKKNDFQVTNVPNPDEKDQTGFNKFNGQFKNGRNYESIEVIGDTINLTLSYVMVILIVLIFISLSYFIFYKKIIK
ncbi:hypothetical protein [Williamsoniiplasma luminosum]|uniref:Uncharacterized protein n=1 Tax=Williamsoniiplasma luminosum TaxID=214888 RepID=A0A2S0NKU6_9MOLU|nr:hypothetical protein [Williamsoniiplasma luminosum]AVP49625.1 MAG: hypothetical protein C5T88_03565 [Williamsoniiplasma luminosum]